MTASNGTSDSASVQVCRAADLSVTKTATGSLTRTYLWDITKSLPDSVPGAVPASTVVNLPYSVVVSSTGHTDSAYKVIGSITVTNPNTWQPVTLTGLSDQLGDGTSCTILTGDVPGTLPASGSATFTYECVYAAGASPAYTGTNTATATWNSAAAHTANGSANGSDGYSLEDSVTEQRTSVTVIDTMSLDGDSGATGTLGTVTLAESPKTCLLYTSRCV